MQAPGSSSSSSSRRRGRRPSLRCLPGVRAAAAATGSVYQSGGGRGPTPPPTTINDAALFDWRPLCAVRRRAAAVKRPADATGSTEACRSPAVVRRHRSDRRTALASCFSCGCLTGMPTAETIHSSRLVDCSPHTPFSNSPEPVRRHTFSPTQYTRPRLPPPHPITYPASHIATGAYRPPLYSLPHGCFPELCYAPSFVPHLPGPDLHPPAPLPTGPGRRHCAIKVPGGQYTHRL